MGRQQREKWVDRQPRTEALIAPSGLQGCEKISFCRLNPKSGTWSQQARDDSGLSGRPAIACHHRKGKAQQRRGTHPGESGDMPRGTTPLHPPSCCWQRGESAVRGRGPPWKRPHIHRHRHRVPSPRPGKPLSSRGSWSDTKSPVLSPLPTWGKLWTGQQRSEAGARETQAPGSAATWPRAETEHLARRVSVAHA